MNVKLMFSIYPFPFFCVRAHMCRRGAISITMYNFGSPRVGNKKFADVYNEVKLHSDFLHLLEMWNKLNFIAILSYVAFFNLNNFWWKLLCLMGKSWRKRIEKIHWFSYPSTSFLSYALTCIYSLFRYTLTPMLQMECRRIYFSVLIIPYILVIVWDLIQTPNLIIYRAEISLWFTIEIYKF